MRKGGECGSGNAAGIVWDKKLSTFINDMKRLKLQFLYDEGFLFARSVEFYLLQEIFKTFGIYLLESRLQKWGDENIQMKLISCTRKRPIWQEISDFIRAAGYEDRDEDACKTRVHTLVSAYRSYKDECEKTGNGTPKRKPAFFDEVDEFLSKKPCTKPKVVVNSSKIIIEADNEEEDNEKIENDEPNEELPSFSDGTSVGSNNKTAGKLPQPNKGECLTGEL